jgi:murein L,D-transpeptidase YafK
LIVIIGGYILYTYGRSLWVPVFLKLRGRRTVEQVVRKIEQPVNGRLEPDLIRAGVARPFSTMTLLAFKQERMLELWTEQVDRHVHVKNYPFTGFSGTLGPKLREGDRQIPEGIYSIEGLNPNSRYYLSIKLNYPNKFDREMAEKDGRKNPGSDIFIHGKTVTVGCIPIGDRAIEELFYLVHTTGKDNVRVIIAPADMRAKTYNATPDMPAWTEELYRTMHEALQEFK